MRKPMLVALAALAACASSKPPLPRSAPGEATVVEVRGAIKGGPFPLSAKALRTLPQASIHGADPATGREETWDGVPLAAIVNDRVNRAKGADTVIVRTADRAAVPIPIVVVRQLRPVLAERADGAPLPAPVLAWPNREQIGLQTDPRQSLWWAHGVTALEIVEYQATFGRALAPPEGAPDGARLGADTFGARCVACHQVRGAGGQKGPDLTSVASRIGPDAFRELLERHPGWADQDGATDTPGRETASQLWTFLHAVALTPRPEPRDAHAGEAGPGAAE